MKDNTQEAIEKGWLLSIYWICLLYEAVIMELGEPLESLLSWVVDHPSVPPTPSPVPRARTRRTRVNPPPSSLLATLIEAHPDVFNLLLQILDDGRCTDSQAGSCLWWLASAGELGRDTRFL